MNFFGRLFYKLLLSFRSSGAQTSEVPPTKCNGSPDAQKTTNHALLLLLPLLLTSCDWMSFVSVMSLSYTQAALLAIFGYSSLHVHTRTESW